MAHGWNDIDWSSTAAWVQAVGALVALGVAIAVPRIDAAFKGRRYRAAVLVVAEQCMQAINYLTGSATAPEGSEPSFELSIPFLVKVLDGYPLDQLGSFEVVRSLLAFRTAATHVVDAYDYAHHEDVRLDGGANLMARRQMSVHVARTQFAALKKAIGGG